MNSYHFMNFPASPRSWPVRPPSWASASRGCHLGGFYHGIGGFSQGFSHDFPRCVQDLWRKSSEIWSDFGSDAGFCWTVRNCRFGSFGSCWDGFWHSLEHSFHDCFFRPRTRLFWAWSRRCLVQLVQPWFSVERCWTPFDVATSTYPNKIVLLLISAFFSGIKLSRTFGKHLSVFTNTSAFKLDTVGYISNRIWPSTFQQVPTFNG